MVPMQLVTPMDTPTEDHSDHGESIARLQSELEMKNWQLEQLRQRLCPQLHTITTALAAKAERRKRNKLPPAIVADRGAVVESFK
jgi:hypothetical protein